MNNSNLGIYIAKRVTDGKKVKGCLISNPEYGEYAYIATIDDMSHTMYVDELNDGQTTIQLIRVLRDTVQSVNKFWLYTAKRMTDGTYVMGCLIHIPDSPFYYIVKLDDIPHDIFAGEFDGGQTTLKLTRVVGHTITTVTNPYVKIGGKYYQIGDHIRVKSAKSILHYEYGMKGEKDKHLTGCTGVILRESTYDKHTVAVLQLDPEHADGYKNGLTRLSVDDELEFL